MLLDEDDSIDERLWEERRNTMTPSVRSARTSPVAAVALIDIGPLMSHLTCKMCAWCRTLLFFFFAHACKKNKKQIKNASRSTLSTKNVLDEGTALRLANVCAREWLAMPGQADSAPQQPWLSVFSLCQPTDYCCSRCCQCRPANGDATLTRPRRCVLSFFFPPPSFVVALPL